MLASIIFALFISGCSGNGDVVFGYGEKGALAFQSIPITWSFTCDFPKDQRDAARSGFTYWNNVSGKELFIETDDCTFKQELPKVRVVRYPGEYEKADNVYATASISMFHDFPHRAGIVFYDMWGSSSRATRESVSRHEVGHALGFEHSGNRGCIMYPFISELLNVRPKPACDAEIEEVKFQYSQQN